MSVDPDDVVEVKREPLWRTDHYRQLDRLSKGLGWGAPWWEKS